MSSQLTLFITLRFLFKFIAIASLCASYGTDKIIPVSGNYHGGCFCLFVRTYRTVTNIKVEFPAEGKANAEERRERGKWKFAVDFV